MPILKRGFQSAASGPDPRIVHENIHPTVFFHDLFEALLHAFTVCYIHIDAVDFRVYFLKFTDKSVKFFHVYVGKNEFDTLFCKLCGSGSADAPCGAGDEGGAVVESHYILLKMLTSLIYIHTFTGAI